MFLFCVLTLSLGCEGLRFGADPVTVETGILVSFFASIVLYSAFSNNLNGTFLIL